MSSPQQVFEGNVSLSQEYLQSVSSTTRDIAAFERIARSIRNSPVDIRGYFAEHGNLDELRAPDIGKTTRVRLLPILTHGIDAVLKMNATPVDVPLDRAVFQAEARAAVNKHRNEIREGE